MLDGKIVDRLLIKQVSLDDKKFYLYSADELDYNYDDLIEGAFFLESLFRDKIPYCVLVVDEIDKNWAYIGYGLYQSNLSRWNDELRDPPMSYLFNHVAFEELWRFIDSLDWLRGMDFDELHKSLNWHLYYFAKDGLEKRNVPEKQISGSKHC